MCALRKKINHIPGQLLSMQINGYLVQAGADIFLVNTGLTKKYKRMARLVGGRVLSTCPAIPKARPASSPLKATCTAETGWKYQETGDELAGNDRAQIKSSAEKLKGLGSNFPGNSFQRGQYAAQTWRNSPWRMGH